MPGRLAAAVVAAVGQTFEAGGNEAQQGVSSEERQLRPALLGFRISTSRAAALASADELSCLTRRSKTTAQTDLLALEVSLHQDRPTLVEGEVAAAGRQGDGRAQGDLGAGKESAGRRASGRRPRQRAFKMKA